MKLDLTPVGSNYVAPVFGEDDRTPVDPRLKSRMRRPMIVGGLVIGVLVIGLGAWASFTSLEQGVSAPGEVRVELHDQTIRHREAGTIRKILVREGQRVRPGQPLLVFDDVESRAATQVYQSLVDGYQAQAARFTAEVTGQPLMFPPDLMARISDPRVAGVVRDQQFLYATRLQLFQSQNSVLGQRREQVLNQIAGDQAQIGSVDVQRALTAEEMAGYQTLYDKGFAPKPLILRYQRSIADLDGRKGSLLADIAKLRQLIGETQMQIAANSDTRTSQAAEGLRDAQAHLADTIPRLTTAKASFDSIVVRSPVDGYVFNLSQFTEGGVAGAGEVLMDVVPANEAIIVTVLIKPEDVDNVHLGMDARVKFTGLNARWNSPLNAKVILVGADRNINEKTGTAAYRVDLRVDPQELLKLRKSARITPGMPAMAMIVTGGSVTVSAMFVEAERLWSSTTATASVLLPPVVVAATVAT